MENIKEHLNWRYGVKRYDPSHKLTNDEMAILQDAILLSPSSYGLQPFKVLFIEDAELRSKLRIASFHQPQVTEASCLIVFAAEININDSFVNAYFDNICKTRGVKLDGSLVKHRDSVISAINSKKPDEKLSWATHQAYLALGFMLLAAAEKKIDANAMEGFLPNQYDEILGLERIGLHAVVIAAAGRRHPEDVYQHLLKVRRSGDELFIKI
jgi:nitroreductase